MKRATFNIFFWKILRKIRKISDRCYKLVIIFPNSAIKPDSCNFQKKCYKLVFIFCFFAKMKSQQVADIIEYCSTKVIIFIKVQ